ncbi:MAG: hypothetical protein R3F21_19040 [Myxococcota bacterium]
MRLQSIDEASDLLTLEEHESASDRVTLQVPVERAPTGLPATTLRLRAALERAESVGMLVIYAAGFLVLGFAL